MMCTTRINIHSRIVETSQVSKPITTGVTTQLEPVRSGRVTRDIIGSSCLRTCLGAETLSRHTLEEHLSQTLGDSTYAIVASGSPEAGQRQTASLLVVR